MRRLGRLLGRSGLPACSLTNVATWRRLPGLMPFSPGRFPLRARYLAARSPRKCLGVISMDDILIQYAIFRCLPLSFRCLKVIEARNTARWRTESGARLSGIYIFIVILYPLKLLNAEGLISKSVKFSCVPVRTEKLIGCAIEFYLCTRKSRG